MKKLLMVEIEASGRYCNNLCSFMTLDARRCTLFDEELTWNSGKKENGNMRPKACRDAEVKP